MTLDRVATFLSTTALIAVTTCSSSAVVRYWAEGPDSGPHGWGYRVVITLLFPK
jgi:hypothetical protein